MSLASRCRDCHSWTARRQFALKLAFAVLVALAIAADLVMVLWLRVPSVTERTWAACAEHPVIAVAGALATVAVCYLVRSDWRFVLAAGGIGGHLFTML